MYIIKGLVNLPGLKTRRKGDWKLIKLSGGEGEDTPWAQPMEYKWNETEEFMMVQAEKS